MHVQRQGLVEHRVSGRFELRCWRGASIVDEDIRIAKGGLRGRENELSGAIDAQVDRASGARDATLRQVLLCACERSCIARHQHNAMAVSAECASDAEADAAATAGDDGYGCWCGHGARMLRARVRRPFLK